jgi:hypothetical protein
MKTRKQTVSPTNIHSRQLDLAAYEMGHDFA